MKKILVVIAATILLASCVNAFQQNYLPVVDTKTAANLQLLTEGATPSVAKSEDMQYDISQAKANGYVVVGEASFNGELQSINNIIAQAKKVKATMVIYSTKYTDTETVTSTSYVPVETVTHSSGKYHGKKYHETSTTSEMVPVPKVSQVRNFDQRAVFFVKSKR